MNASSIDIPGLIRFFTRDPDGNRIELVQWPPGHADGLSNADFADRNLGLNSIAAQGGVRRRS